MIFFFIFVFLMIGPSLEAAPGDLDSTFDADGIVVTAFPGGGFDIAGQSIVMADGRILTGGAVSNGTDFDAGLARYLSDGSPDTTFDGDGLFSFPVGVGDDFLGGGLLLEDGRILVIGAFEVGSEADIFLARLLHDGGLDPAFGTGGIVITPVSGNVDSVVGIGLLSDGRIATGGFSGGDFLAVRYLPDGSLDNTFDGDGMATTDISGGADFGRAMVLQPDGKIVVAGDSAPDDFAVVRYNTDGSLDPGFDGDGIVTTSVTSNHRFQAVTLTDDQKIVAAGFADDGVANAFAVARYLSDGTIDTSFDGDGVAILSLAAGQDLVNGVVVQKDGRILVVGESDNGPDSDFGIARFDPDGNPDTTFSTDGQILLPIGAGDDIALGVTLLPDGRALISGTDGNDFVLVRLLGNAADLRIDKTAPSEAKVGDSFDFVVTVTNDGPDEAIGVTVTDTLPSEVAPDSTTPSQGSCSGTTTITCDLGSLSAGSSATVTCQVIGNTAGEAVTNTASVSGAVIDPDETNNTAQVIMILKSAGGCSLIR